MFLIEIKMKYVNKSGLIFVLLFFVFFFVFFGCVCLLMHIICCHVTELFKSCMCGNILVLIDEHKEKKQNKNC